MLKMMLLIYNALRTIQPVKTTKTPDSASHNIVRPYPQMLKNSDIVKCIYGNLVQNTGPNTSRQLLQVLPEGLDLGLVNITNVGH